MPGGTTLKPKKDGDCKAAPLKPAAQQCASAEFYKTLQTNRERIIHITLEVQDRSNISRPMPNKPRSRVTERLGDFSLRNVLSKIHTKHKTHTNQTGKFSRNSIFQKV
jgi:hypothetical protein